MTKEEARLACIRDWMALPSDERQTESQAALFAMKIKARYAFRASGDKYQVVKGWLQRHLDQTSTHR